MNLHASSHGRVVPRARSGSSGLRNLLVGCTALLALGACSEGAPDDGAGPSGAAAASSGGASSGAAGRASAGTATSAGAGGTTTGTSGASSAGSGGFSTAGRSDGGSAGLGGARGGSASGAGGTSMGGGSGAGGRGAGGMPPAGGGGLGAGGSGDTAGAGGGTTECTRELLQSAVDAYFTALAAHDPSTLPLATNVKFTENGKVMAIGQDGLWKTAGALKYEHSLLDTAICNAASEAVVPDGTMDIPFALRIALAGGQITEVETIAVRPGDYVVSGSPFASDTGAIISSAAAIGWEDPVPEAQRATREELTGWMDKYFEYFPNGVCNTDSSCKRLENGGGSFSCSAGASCSSGSPPAKPQAVSHILLGDVETGIGAGFDLFTGADVDMHMFKMKGGKVYAVHAILGAAKSTGWE